MKVSGTAGSPENRQFPSVLPTRELSRSGASSKPGQGRKTITAVQNRTGLCTRLVNTRGF